MDKMSAQCRWISQLDAAGVAFALCVSLTACAPGTDASTVDRGQTGKVTGAAGFAGAVAGNHALGSGAAGRAGSSPVVGMAGVPGSVVTSPNVPRAGAPGAGNATTKPPGFPTAGAGSAAPPPMTGTAGATVPTGAAGSGTTGPAGDICARWKSDRTNLSEGTWNGDAASCMAGDMTQDARNTAYKLHTLYRFMAGLDPVPMTDDYNKKAQDCSLLMTANGMISHMPDMSWKCYTADAAKTAGGSSLSSGGAVSSVDGYMIDPGNPTTLGHRRWILSNELIGVGFGSSGKFSCQYQPPGRGKSTKPWIAWPPAGQIPIQAMSSTWSSIDQTGWSLQSDTVDFKNAQVTIMAAGMSLPVTVTQLGSGYGSTFAISMVPMGWKAAAGMTYNVNVTGASMPITYDVSVVDCK
jgi:hypothetical protein